MLGAVWGCAAEPVPDGQDVLCLACAIVGMHGHTAEAASLLLVLGYFRGCLPAMMGVGKPCWQALRKGLRSQHSCSWNECLPNTALIHNGKSKRKVSHTQRSCLSISVRVYRLVTVACILHNALACIAKAGVPLLVRKLPRLSVARHE